MDVADTSSVRQAAETAAALLPNGLDWLISNAGVALQPGVTYEDWYVAFCAHPSLI